MCKQGDVHSSEAPAAPEQVFAPLEEAAFSKVSAVCLGTGRFLRAVLVPALTELGEEVVLAQTRGTSFGTYMQRLKSRCYEVDTVQHDGSVVTAAVPVAACGSLGTEEGRAAFMELPGRLPGLRIVGLGLTEAGITHNGRSIIDLAEFLHECFHAGLGRGSGILSVINTDNMPFNGDAIGRLVRACDFTASASGGADFLRWLDDSVVFHNTMVDRITSHRVGDSDVPRAEPLPAKALVIEDLRGVLPERMSSAPGVVIRASAKQLEQDIALKLRIANGLHTAMVYAMALGRLYQTDACIGHPDILPYLTALYDQDIVHSCEELGMPRDKATPVFAEWMARLQHPHFGLGCLFVCQNATQKLGIRLAPSVRAEIAAGAEPSRFMAFAIAAALRFITPLGEQPRLDEKPAVFVGRFDAAMAEAEVEDWEYTSGLWARPGKGEYEFRDGDGRAPMLLRALGEGGDLEETARVVSEVLSAVDLLDPKATPAHGRLAEEVARLLHRMLQGEPALSVLASVRGA
mmetsp:Transcript_47618/g.136995  ORF Transcript_47618/g.136995 Transcript_47618/m.136995 type:complete len:518 (-) Transcript_47618:260-1813(-)